MTTSKFSLSDLHNLVQIFKKLTNKDYTLVVHSDKSGNLRYFGSSVNLPIYCFPDIDQACNDLITIMANSKNYSS